MFSTNHLPLLDFLDATGNDAVPGKLTAGFVRHYIAYHARMARSEYRNPVLTGLPPVYAADARVLILGSMPGGRSLEAQAYYAHSRNAFWPIMARLFDFSPTLAYTIRLARLRANSIALWDVIGSCRRRGSLDQKVEPASVVVNDFEWLFRACPEIRLIVFNGRLAEHSFERYVVPALSASLRQLPRKRLPSTSPAHAAMSFEQKFDAWRAALNPVLFREQQE